MNTETGKNELFYRDDVIELCKQSYTAGYERGDNELENHDEEKLVETINKRIEFYKANGSSKRQGEARPFNARVSRTWIDVEAKLPEVHTTSKGFWRNEELLLLKYKPFGSYETGVLTYTHGKLEWEIGGLGIKPLESVEAWMYIPK